MIDSFIHKGLKELFETGETGKVDKHLHARILRRLDVMHNAKDTKDLNVPGFDFHPLKGYKPTRYSVHVNGPWCITFEFENETATRVDLEQYH
ncbi:type II toxin-antitoxin system RelE/ParE family toxin [Salinarimonas sp.]|uniref:type II toxin-antitoxin system RelE/ParE family toxin n=1 Tax=Salinarimonas sp. TaxID=2766526 RepID=UPI0032D99702